MKVGFTIALDTDEEFDKAAFEVRLRRALIAAGLSTWQGVTKLDVYTDKRFAVNRGAFKEGNPGYFEGHRLRKAQDAQKSQTAEDQT